MSDREKLEFLDLGLRNLGHRRSFSRNAKLDEVYFRIQATLLAIPGHAQYYADALAEARKKTERPWMDSTYLRQYRMTRDILIHLPSPETIRVMGGMLESEEDIRSHEETVQIIREIQRTGGGNFNLTAPRKLAYLVLTKIGLRNCPDTMEQLMEWWAQVKSGSLAFSFVGQAVEHRFKPDGTVETSVMENPPDDTPAPPEPRRQPETRTEPLGATSEPPSGRPFWPWIGAGLLIAALAGAWLAKKRSA